MLLYSSRFRRRAVTRPGSGLAARSIRSYSLRSSPSLARFRRALGFGTPFGGISPDRIFWTTISQTLRSFSACSAVE